MKRLWTRRTVTAPPIEHPERSAAVIGPLAEMLRAGHVECRGCGAINSRSEDDDHGQPAYCTSCGSYALRYVPAAIPHLEPEDLHD